MGIPALVPECETVDFDDEQLPAIMAHHHFGSCQGALLSAAASSTGIHLRCSGQLLFPVESQEDVKRPLQRSMIAEVMERDNQIS